MDLRKIVGHRTLMQEFFRRAHAVLGAGGEHFLSFFFFQMSHIRTDETVEECARRELLEEMGLVAEELEFFMINSGPEAHYIYPNGDEVSNVEIIYLCRKYHGELRRQEEEMEELRFFAPEEITLDMISPPIRPVVFRLLEKLRQDSAGSSH